MGKNYYHQVFLGECKHMVKERKLLKYINEGLEVSSDSDESGKE